MTYTSHNHPIWWILLNHRLFPYPLVSNPIYFDRWFEAFSRQRSLSQVSTLPHTVRNSFSLMLAGRVLSLLVSTIIDRSESPPLMMDVTTVIMFCAQLHCPSRQISNPGDSSLCFESCSLIFHSFACLCRFMPRLCQDLLFLAFNFGWLLHLLNPLFRGPIQQGSSLPYLIDYLSVLSFHLCPTFPLILLSRFLIVPMVVLIAKSTFPLIMLLPTLAIQIIWLEVEATI